MQRIDYEHAHTIVINRSPWFDNVKFPGINWVMSNFGDEPDFVTENGRLVWIIWTGRTGSVLVASYSGGTLRFVLASEKPMKHLYDEEMQKMIVYKHLIKSTLTIMEESCSTDLETGSSQ